MSGDRFIAAPMAPHPVAHSGRVLGVARSGSDAWRRVPSARVHADAPLKERISATHQTTSGHRRPPAHSRRAARDRGAARAPTCCSTDARGRAARLPRAAPSDADNDAGSAGDPGPNRVGRTFTSRTIGTPDRLGVADLSFGSTREGWLYLAVILDAFSRRMVGWAMADHLRTELVLDARTMAIRHRRPAPDLIHHSDHGCQYTSLAFGQRLPEAGLLPLMGTVGDCFDNAVAESFFATLEVELLHCQVWQTRAAAR